MGYGVDSVILYTTLKISGLALAVCGVLAEHDFDVDSGCTEKPINRFKYLIRFIAKVVI